MAAEIVMPRLSDSMEEGTVLKWMKSVGDEVAVGDELVEIETDKANMVYESDEAGTLIEIVAGEGDTLPIGEVIARVGDESEASDTASKEEQPPAEGEGPEDAERGSSAVHAPHDPRVHAADAPRDASAPSPTQSDSPSDASASSPTQPSEPSEPAPAEGDSGNGRVKASPIARRVAKEKGVELGGLEGSGPGGRIIKADVEGAVGDGDRAPAPATSGETEKAETAKGQVETVELTKLQKTVSRRMAESKATAPHFYLQAEVDMSACVASRSRLKSSAGEGEVIPSFNDMIVKACAIALREFPRANGAYRDGRIELYSRVNVGIAVAAQDALVVPTIFDADQKGLRRIATESRELAGKVREGKVTPPELSGGTFTVSNLGMYGVSNFHAVINPPQAGILAVGAIVERPFVRDGELITAQTMGVTLACDHRILYGADGAEFLARVRSVLEEPLGLAL